MKLVERTTVHISDDTGRLAMEEKRLPGYNASDDNNTLALLTRYIYSNHLQSASLELDGSGAIISYEEYHPYGTTSYQAMNATITACAKRYRYTGKERDEESGLYYHGARYYVPWLGRWCASDPLESKYAGMSPYNYSFNNPIVWNDLSGADPNDSPKSGGWYSDSNGKMHFLNGVQTNEDFKKTGIKGNFQGDLDDGNSGTKYNDDGTITHYRVTSSKSVNTSKVSKPSSAAPIKQIPKPASVVSSNYVKFEQKTPSASAPLLLLATSIETGIEADILTPDPSDLIPQKWLGIIALAAIALTLELVAKQLEKEATETAVKPLLEKAPFLRDPITGIEENNDKDYFIKYTNKEGIEKIMREQTIRPNDKGKVYLTKSFKNPEDVERDIFLNQEYGKGRGDYMAIFLIDPDQSIDITKSISDPLEWVYYPGSLKIRTGNLLYIGPNLIKK